MDATIVFRFGAGDDGRSSGCEPNENSEYKIIMNFMNKYGARTVFCMCVANRAQDGRKTVALFIVNKVTARIELCNYHFENLLPMNFR